MVKNKKIAELEVEIKDLKAQIARLERRYVYLKAGFDLLAEMFYVQVVLAAESPVWVWWPGWRRASVCPRQKENVSLQDIL